MWVERFGGVDEPGPVEILHPDGTVAEIIRQPSAPQGLPLDMARARAVAFEGRTRPFSELEEASARNLPNVR